MCTCSRSSLSTQSDLPVNSSHHYSNACSHAVMKHYSWTWVYCVLENYLQYLPFLFDTVYVVCVLTWIYIFLQSLSKELCLYQEHCQQQGKLHSWILPCIHEGCVWHKYQYYAVGVRVCFSNCLPCKPLCWSVRSAMNMHSADSW